MNRTEGETAILLDAMYRGPFSDYRSLYERMHPIGQSGLDLDEFAKTFSALVDQGYLLHDKSEGYWHLTAKGIRRCAVPQPLADAAQKARNEALYATQAPPDRLALNSSIGAVGSRIGEAIEAALPALVRIATDTRDGAQDIERGLDSIADAINNLADAVRGTPTCADGEAADAAAYREIEQDECTL